jgi:hypothetical protein
MSCCCACQNASALPGVPLASPSLTPGDSALGGASLYDEFMSDTVGVLWRAASGTVDPWTKQMLICQQVAGVTAAGGSSSTATTQANGDVTTTLTTFSTPGNSTGADPSQFLDGLKNSISSAFCLTNNLGTSILYIGLGILALVVAWHYFTNKDL